MTMRDTEPMATTTAPADPTLALAALGLDDDERAAIRYATMPLVPMERLELLHFLGYPETLPEGTTARVAAVVEQILRRRGHGA